MLSCLTYWAFAKLSFIQNSIVFTSTSTLLLSLDPYFLNYLTVSNRVLTWYKFIMGTKPSINYY